MHVCNFPGVYPYSASEGAGIINLFNAEAIVEEYVKRVFGSSVDLESMFKRSEEAGRLEAFLLPFPMDSGVGNLTISCEDVATIWGFIQNEQVALLSGLPVQILVHALLVGRGLMSWSLHDCA